MTETHRLSLLPHWAHRAPSAFDADTRRFLWRLRWRPPPRDPRRLWTILAAVLLAHVLALTGLRSGMRPPLPQPRVATNDIIEVQLLEPSLPPAVPPATRELQPLTVHAPPAPATMPRLAPSSRRVAREPPEPSAAAARIYNAEGEVLLPAGALSAPPRPVPEYRVALPEATPGLMEHKTPITYTPTRFEKDWVPANESALETAVRKTVMEATVLPLPGGHSVKCVISPLTLGLGCGIDGPHQLSAPLEVKHERDNLAPATPLIKPKTPPDSAHSASVPARPASIATPSSVAPAAALPLYPGAAPRKPSP